MISSAVNRTLLFLLAIVCVFSTQIYSQTTSAQPGPDISGTWRGTLVAGQFDPLEIVFHIRGDAGSYTATLDIPAQSRIGLPVDSVSVNGSNVNIRMNTLQAEYYASIVLSDDGRSVDAFNGDWGQSGEHIPLRMLRSPAL